MAFLGALGPSRNLPVPSRFRLIAAYWRLAFLRLSLGLLKGHPCSYIFNSRLRCLNLSDLSLRGGRSSMSLCAAFTTSRSASSLDVASFTQCGWVLALLAVSSSRLARLDFRQLQVGLGAGPFFTWGVAK